MEEKTDLGQLPFLDILDSFLHEPTKQKEEIVTVQCIREKISSSIYDSDDESQFEEECEEFSILKYLMCSLFCFVKKLILPEQKDTEKKYQKELIELHQEELIECEESVPAFNYPDEQPCLKPEKRKQCNRKLNENVGDLQEAVETENVCDAEKEKHVCFRNDSSKNLHQNWTLHVLVVIFTKFWQICTKSGPYMS